MAVWQFDLDFEHTDDGRDLSAVATELVMVQLAQSVGPSKSMMDAWRYFGDKDPTTRRLLETILVDEEEHAEDLRDLLEE